MRSVSGCCSLPSTPTPSLLLSFYPSLRSSARVPPHTRPLSVVYIPLSFSISFNEHHPPSLTALPFPCSPPAIYPPLRPLPVFLSFRDTFSRSLASLLIVPRMPASSIRPAAVSSEFARCSSRLFLWRDTCVCPPPYCSIQLIEGLGVDLDCSALQLDAAARGKQVACGESERHQR